MISIIPGQLDFCESGVGVLPNVLMSGPLVLPQADLHR